MVGVWDVRKTRMTLACLAALGVQQVGCGGTGQDGEPEEAPQQRLTEPLPAGDPIEAPAAEWKWVDFPRTRCMDDSPTGLGIKLNPGSDELLIVIQGGGACFNTLTCATAANGDGFGEADLAGNTDAGILSDDDDDNPFKGWNKVFIPYCSGDIFSGTALDGEGYEGRTQAGYLNIRHYLTRLVPTFSDASRVVLSGQSAGGFAASINWIQAIEGWGPEVRVDVLNDSGPPIGEDYMPPCMQQRLAEIWNWDDNVPAACADCDVEAGQVTEPVMRWSIGHTKQYRHALISSSEDRVMKLFNGFGQNDCASIDALLPPAFPEGLYPEALQDLQDDIFADHPGARGFIIDSAEHVWTSRSPGAVESEGVVLRDWIEDFLDPESDWESVTPF